MVPRVLCIAILILFAINLSVKARPQEEIEVVEIDNATSQNGTHKELYVIRQVVYEVGVLVDVNNTDSEDTEIDNSESSELVDDQIQLTIFGSSHNGTLEFGDVPLPVQVNTSGHVMTGLQPIHVGQISNLTALADALPFTGTIVNVTKTESTFLVPDKLNASSAEMVDVENSNENLLNKFSAIKENLPPIGAGAL
ncbi:uncharacterized protein LOC134829610 [Culicoides brevitarsis]|uniref:uncharacterized protein LOC134829610 n=1 Tax=Culicoides brevitarsis TaxID=469753 RepID=UPI00307B4B5D